MITYKEALRYSARFLKEFFDVNEMDADGLALSLIGRNEPHTIWTFGVIDTNDVERYTTEIISGDKVVYNYTLTASYGYVAFVKVYETCDGLIWCEINREGEMYVGILS